MCDRQTDSLTELEMAVNTCVAFATKNWAVETVLEGYQFNVHKVLNSGLYHIEILTIHLKA